MKKVTVLLLFIFSATLYGSCIRDDAGTSGTGTGTGTSVEQVQVKVSLRLPGQVGTSTRALTDDQKAEITSVDAVVFDQNGKFLYQSTTNYLAETGNPVSAYLSMYITDQPVIVHLYVNIPSLSNVRFPAPGASEQEIIDIITVDLPSANYNKLSNPLPMWGRFELPSVPKDGFLTAPACRMLRSVARIDVGSNYDMLGAARPLANFKLSSATVIRARDRAQVAPDISEWLANSASGVMVTPCVPAGAGTADYTDAAYLTETAVSPDGLAIERELYVYENQSGLDAENAMCIIVGGYFEADSDPSYYKVFMGDDPGKAIVRNHCYRMNITQVEDRGWPSIEEALKHEPSDMMVVEVTEWDEGNNDNVFDGTYRLTTDKGAVIFDKYGGELWLEVTTDFPDGFTVETSPGLDAWLTSIAPLSGMAGESVRIRITVPEDNSGGHADPVNDYILIKAGNLHKQIPVTQGYDVVDLTLQLSQNEFHFGLNGNAPYHLDPTQAEAQTLELSWTPSNATVTLASIYPQNGGVPLAQGDPIGMIQNNRGTASFEIRAEPFAATPDPNPTRERSDLWLVSVTHPDHPGMATTRMISVKQMDYGISLSATALNLGYKEYGTAQLLTVNSSAEYIYTLSGDIAETLDVIEGLQPGVGAGVLAGGSERGTDQINFRPFIYPAATGTPAAGTVYNVTARFETTDPLSNQNPQDVIISRTVPAHFTFHGATTNTVAAAGGRLLLRATTNAQWGYTGNGQGSGASDSHTVADQQTILAGPYTANKQIYMPVGASGWTARTGTNSVNAVIYYLNENGQRISQTYAIATQPAQYSLAHSSNNTVANIDGNGQTFTFRFTGLTNTAFYVEAVVGSTRVAISNNDTNLTKTITVPAYATKQNGSVTYSDRSVLFRFYHPINGLTNIVTRTQKLAYHTVGSYKLVQNQYGPSTWANRNNLSAGGCPSGYSSTSNAQLVYLMNNYSYEQYRNNLGGGYSMQYWYESSAGGTAFTNSVYNWATDQRPSTAYVRCWY